MKDDKQRALLQLFFDDMNNKEKIENDKVLKRKKKLKKIITKIIIYIIALLLIYFFIKIFIFVIMELVKLELPEGIKL